MPTLRDVIAGPWRAVLVLGVTQILAWGAFFYPPVLTVPLIAAEHGWSMAFAMGGFSLALLTAGMVSPRVGHSPDVRAPAAPGSECRQRGSKSILKRPVVRPLQVAVGNLQSAALAFAARGPVARPACAAERCYLDNANLR